MGGGGVSPKSQILTGRNQPVKNPPPFHPLHKRGIISSFWMRDLLWLPTVCSGLQIPPAIRYKNTRAVKYFSTKTVRAAKWPPPTAQHDSTDLPNYRSFIIHNIETNYRDCTKLHRLRQLHQKELQLQMRTGLPPPGWSNCMIQCYAQL